MPSYASGVTFLDKLQGIVIVHQDFGKHVAFLCVSLYLLTGFSPLYQGVY